MMRNAATTEVRAAKKYFEQRIAKESKDNPKAFWKYVKSKTVCKTNVGNLKYNGKMAETDMEKAEMLNLFFSNVYTDEDQTMPDVNTSPADYFICDISRAVTSRFVFYLSKSRSRSKKIYSSRSRSSSKKIYLSRSRK